MLERLNCALFLKTKEPREDGLRRKRVVRWRAKGVYERSPGDFRKEDGDPQTVIDSQPVHLGKAVKRGKIVKQYIKMTGWLFARKKGVSLEKRIWLPPLTAL